MNDYVPNLDINEHAVSLVIIMIIAISCGAILSIIAGFICGIFGGQILMNKQLLHEDQV